MPPARLLCRVLCLLMCLIHGSVAYVRSISEDQFPYMIDTDSRKPLRWGRGSLLQRVLGSTAVRVTDNRIRFIPAGWALVAVEGASTTCRPQPEVLCVVEGDDLNTEDGVGAMGVGNGSRIFPFFNTGVTIHSNTKHTCTHGVGRTCMATPSVLYDVSVCDTVDGSLDVLFTDDRVQLLHVDINNQLYVVAGILVVLLIVLVTQNLAVDIMAHDDVGEKAVSVDICMVLSILLTVCSCVLPGVAKGYSAGLFIPIVTHFDMYYFFLIIGYMTLHCIRWVKCIVNSFYRRYVCRVANGTTDNGRTGKLHSVNFMVSALLLAIFSTHGTIETVLTTPLLFVFLFRTLFKLYAIETSCDTKHGGSRQNNTTEAFLISIDCIIVAATHKVGTESLGETYLHGTSTFCIIFFLAHALAYEGNRNRRPIVTETVTKQVIPPTKHRFV
jgi:hypothetical protein